MPQSIIQSDGKQGQPQRKILSDIVFTIDVSASMSPCIEGVKKNVIDFIGGLQKESAAPIDYRLGLLAHTWNGANILFFKKDFSSDLDDFRKAVTSLSTGVDEANFPALDWSLDFNWRKAAHKFILMFTDEPIDGGWEPSASRDKINELTEKIRNLGASVYLASFNQPGYEDYQFIGSTDKCEFIPVGDYANYDRVEFKKLMEKLGKTVGQNSQGRVDEVAAIRQDIYGVKSIVQLTSL
jgi:hypothetical protein